MAEEWFYAVGGQQRGPVSIDVLRSMIASGKLAPTDMAWQQGMAEWAPLSSLPEMGGMPVGGLYEANPIAHQLSYGGYQQAQPGPLGPHVRYGGFWIRVGAFIIDEIILVIASMVFGFACGLLLAIGGVNRSPDAMVAANALIQLVAAVGSWLYFIMMESSSKQATVGKMACGLIVTDSAGKRLTFGRAAGRFFSKIISGIVFCVGYIVIAFDPQKRGWHDQIAGTLVIEKSSLLSRSY